MQVNSAFIVILHLDSRCSALKNVLVGSTLQDVKGTMKYHISSLRINYITNTDKFIKSMFDLPVNPIFWLNYHFIKVSF